MRTVTTSSFWANLSKFFFRAYVSAILNHAVSFMKSRRCVRKIPEAPLGTSSTETLDMLASLFLIGLLFLYCKNITIHNIFKQQDSLKLGSNSYPKVWINGSIERDFRIPLDLFHFSWKSFDVFVTLP